MSQRPRIAVIDNSLDPDLYQPVAHWKKYIPFPVVSFRAPEGKLPDLDDGYTHLILTGSEASIVQRDDWVREEVFLVREAVKKNLALLGSCYGHQLLALALLGEEYVRRASRPEIGWLEIKASEKSQLFGWLDSFFAFSIHFDEVINLPPPFRVLARTPDCSVQAFTVAGEKIWGIQFHPEISIPEARHFLVKLIGQANPHRALYEAALRSEPRDSGVIHHITSLFLSA
ncbi:MAG: type 1 glutamine amidotransferase [Candidatus Aminicenantales bacterium]